ncbi:MAG: hypothetical protein GY809_28005 [Planctomycetes bacterium]|nr:hypothetical protein [Planctomycetota bacterium]
MENVSPQDEQSTPEPRLGFHEIVPGYDNDAPLEHDPEINIPEFDLSQRLMVSERRESAARRQGPGTRQEPDPTPPEASPIPEAPVAVSVPAERQVSAYRHPVVQRHAIVEDIVRRDIERLCMASQAG